jgi:sporulation protein YlmC with PRC-barrel domain
MLMLSNTLHNRPIMSLRSGAQIGVAVQPIINPHNLKILGWWCSSNAQPGDLVLLSDDIRENMPTGLAINDETDLCAPSDLVRHKDILQIHFQLIDKTVKTKSSKLGKVSDFSYDDSMFVQKLYVEKPLVKVFSANDTLLIDRNQILEVTDDYILVDEADSKVSRAKAIRANTAPAT